VTAFVSERENRWQYASEALTAIEAWNCAKGCARGLADPAAFEEFGPGGTCHLLALVALGDGQPIPELDDDGDTVTCTAREPL